MNAGPELAQSDYIVFVDESGDHGLAKVDPNYPMFVLALCVFLKREYIDVVCAAVQRFKFKHWGHDSVVLHEHDIRKPSGSYGFLFNEARRRSFMDDLNAMLESTMFTLIASVVRKNDLARTCALPANPYHLGLSFGLERLYKHLEAAGQTDRLTHVVVERRGRRGCRIGTRIPSHMRRGERPEPSSSLRYCHVPERIERARDADCRSGGATDRHQDTAPGTGEPGI